jgi:transposase InsO family protein
MPEFTAKLNEAKVLIEQWQKEYNQVRPHSSLDYRLPAPDAIIPVTLTKKVVSFIGSRPIDNQIPWL